MTPRRVSADEFRGIHQRRVEQVLGHWNDEMQREIARHCVGWAPDRFDFRPYLERSWIRNLRAYESIASVDARRIVDVGGFFGVLPLVLRDLGFDVTMTETLRYYSDAFAPLFRFLQSEGVSILDYDPFDHEPLTVPGFDAVLVMAVLEHYPHSLRTFCTNVRALANSAGIVYLEVPNVAYWPKRWALFRRGQSPLAPIEEIWDSDVPFLGHHHEFTVGELRTLTERAGLEIVREESFNYSVDHDDWRLLLTRPWRHLFPAWIPTAREVLGVTCRLTGALRG